MLDYDSLKFMAKSIGRTVKDLLALSPANDPFYAGTGARRQNAEWFAAIWADHVAVGFHLRRIHYRMVSSTAPILKPDGSAYQNTDDDWKLLGTASLSARYLDLVPFDGMIDRRNDEPMIFAKNLDADPDKEIEVSCEVACEEPVVDGIDIPDMPALPALSLNAGYPVQKYIVEVWIEKSTQNDWLIPLCQRRGVNLVVGTGEQSETRVRELAFRAAEYGAPVRIIYLSDFDPGGRSMPKAVARKIEFTIAKFNLDIDLRLIPLALTPEQCRQYGLPRIPIKDSERRKNKFESTFGVGATELDALEALYPGELARLLNAEIDRWVDPDLARRASRFRAEQDVLLARIGRDVHDSYAEEIMEIERRFSEIAQRLANVASQFGNWEEEAAELWRTIAADLENERPDLSAAEMPRSAAPGSTERFVLFDSKRDYFTQMDFYNSWRDGDSTAMGARRDARPDRGSYSAAKSRAARCSRRGRTTAPPTARSRSSSTTPRPRGSLLIRSRTTIRSHAATMSAKSSDCRNSNRRKVKPRPEANGNLFASTSTGPRTARRICASRK